MLFLLIGVLCSFPPFHLPSHITAHYCSTHPNPLFVTPDSLQYYINSWRSCPSLSHCLNLHLLHKIWFCFTFACFTPAHYVCSLTPFCLYSLVSSQRKKHKKLSYPGRVSLFCYLSIFVFFHKTKTFRCILQRRQHTPVCTAFFLNTSQQSPRCSPFQITSFSDSWVFWSLRWPLQLHVMLHLLLTSMCLLTRGETENMTLRSGQWIFSTHRGPYFVILQK